LIRRLCSLRYFTTLGVLNNTSVKVRQSGAISAFGGMNFVFEHFNKLQISEQLDETLPKLAYQSNYSWKDVLYSLTSIFYCGGDCIEDLGAHLKPHLSNSPLIQVPSPDTILRRMSMLAEGVQHATTPKGTVTHDFCRNSKMETLLIRSLKRLNAFEQSQNVLDYDNTIIFNEKADSKMTYKRNPGYQPGVCLLNEKHVLYVENRGGNSDAKSFQNQSLSHMFSILEAEGIAKIDLFRADAASYQYEVVKLLQQKVKKFYIGCRNSYVEKYYSQVSHWSTVQDENVCYEVGEINITPFSQQAEKENHVANSFRLIVKRKPRPDGQTDLITQDAYEYRSILTNCTDGSAEECARLYDRRGNAEKQFDILKNDFGWGHLPFSEMAKNLVFMCFTALCRNLYNFVIEHFAAIVETLEPHFRLKKFTFRFIILPAKWVKQSRGCVLRIYGANPCPV
jgi:Transposase DDE domain group 1